MIFSDDYENWHCRFYAEQKLKADLRALEVELVHRRKEIEGLKKALVKIAAFDFLLNASQGPSMRIARAALEAAEIWETVKR